MFTKLIIPMHTFLNPIQQPFHDVISSEEEYQQYREAQNKEHGELKCKQHKLKNYIVSFIKRPWIS